MAINHHQDQHALKWKASRLRDWNKVEGETLEDAYILAWNEKLLDYEIETMRCEIAVQRCTFTLKWKASRLRDWNVGLYSLGKGGLEILKWKASRLRDWNIESDGDQVVFVGTWNEKLLDYEIETQPLRKFLCESSDLKWKASRLRDWNRWEISKVKRFHGLKWKASRLRDWNLIAFVPHQHR